MTKQLRSAAHTVSLVAHAGVCHPATVSVHDASSRAALLAVQKLQEGSSELQAVPREVESADDFLRATALRHRWASLP